MLGLQGGIQTPWDLTCKQMGPHYIPILYLVGYLILNGETDGFSTPTLPRSTPALQTYSHKSHYSTYKRLSSRPPVRLFFPLSNLVRAKASKRSSVVFNGHYRPLLRADRHMDVLVGVFLVCTCGTTIDMDIDSSRSIDIFNNYDAKPRSSSTVK